VRDFSLFLYISFGYFSVVLSFKLDHCHLHRFSAKMERQQKSIEKIHKKVARVVRAVHQNQ